MVDNIDKFNIYCDNLLKWNEVMNLTAITERSEVEKLHFEDSLALLNYLDFTNKKIIDVGTGAGFPGLPLKIAEPTIELTLLDALDKRLNFLKDTCEKLELNDITLVHSRAEEIPTGFRENFDIAVSRAVANLSILAELCLPYVKIGGSFVAMKGPNFDEELELAKPIIKQLGGKTSKCETYTIPNTDVVHSVIIIEKLSSTPAEYPRTWNKIKHISRS